MYAMGINKTGTGSALALYMGQYVPPELGHVPRTSLLKCQLCRGMLTLTGVLPCTTVVQRLLQRAS